MQEKGSYENIKNKKVNGNGVMISHGDLFVFTPNPKLLVKDNLDTIFESIRYLLSDRKDNDFTIKLEVMTSKGEKQACMEITNSLREAAEQAKELYRDELVMSGVDKEGKPVYQRRGDVKR